VAGGRRRDIERKTGAEPLHPSNFKGWSQPASRGYIPSGATPFPPLFIQTATVADPLPRLCNQTHGNWGMTANG
jgi:hypothetical protein